MTHPTVPLSPSAARMRRRRQRAREGVVTVTLQISREGARELARLGWLPDGQRDDPRAVALAVLAIGGAALAKGLRA